ncbi:hypothetical protein H8S90_16520 [Olivibacter sp. SDN3]|uniref:hypothetical protein n=1 Tax=Olivibacter sp. SDN3 TaxID=2764720 RepID=UPI0016514435|nr:hypothetical protein [Olivibacter sp. SDN3]QNL48389.1 hypothetical protein H8S90_16520 [Olivibacter sp. SDN3]
MNKHCGEIVEKTIRRNGCSISELARLMKVNRRSIYNWFNQPKLKEDVIFKIGCALAHDFSSEFPKLFSKEDFQEAFLYNGKLKNSNRLVEEQEKVNYWKDKYIALLEEYNQILSINSTGKFDTMVFST